MLTSNRTRGHEQQRRVVGAFPDPTTQRSGRTGLRGDLFDDLDEIMKALDRLRFAKHEVILYHLWDPWERDLPLEGHYKFHDLETGEVLQTQADAVRENYLAEVKKWRQEVETMCRNRSIDRVELTADDPLDQALLDYLVRRAKSF